MKELEQQVAELQLQISTADTEKHSSSQLLEVIADKDAKYAEAQKSMTYLKSKLEIAEKV